MTHFDVDALPEGSTTIRIGDPVVTVTDTTMIVPHYLLEMYRPMLDGIALRDFFPPARSTPFEFPPPLHVRWRRKITNKVIDVRERSALKIAPWLDRDGDW